MSSSCGYVVGVVFRIVVLGDFVIAARIVIGGVVVVGPRVVAGAGIVGGIVDGLLAVVVVELADVVVFEHEKRIISMDRALKTSFFALCGHRMCSLFALNKRMVQLGDSPYSKT